MEHVNKYFKDLKIRGHSVNGVINFVCPGLVL